MERLHISFILPLEDNIALAMNPCHSLHRNDSTKQGEKNARFHCSSGGARRSPSKTSVIMRARARYPCI